MFFCNKELRYRKLEGFLLLFFHLTFYVLMLILNYLICGTFYFCQGNTLSHSRTAAENEGQLIIKR